MTDRSAGLIVFLAMALFMGRLVWRMGWPSLAGARWARAGRRLGLKRTAEFLLEGTREDLRVEARASAKVGSGLGDRWESATWTTHVRVTVADPPEALRIDARARVFSQGADFTTGDAVFDREVAVRGSSLYVRSLLDASARATLAKAVRCGWSFADGAWVRQSDGLSGVGRLVAEGLALGRLLSGSREGTAARLVAQVEGPWSPAARAQALRLLATRARGTAALERALAVAREDIHGELALAAALIDQSCDGIARVALGALDEGERIQALMALVTRFPDDVATARAIDRLLGRGPTEPIPLREALVSAVAASSSPEREARLCLLVADPERRVALRAVEALSEHGTVAAVAALVPLRDHALGGPLAAAARDAIASIRARAPHAEAGGLTLAAVTGGELTLTGEPKPAPAVAPCDAES